MNRRTIRMLTAVGVAVVLVVVGIVVANQSGSTGNAAQPTTTQAQPALATTQAQPALATTQAQPAPASQPGTYPVSADQAGTVALASSPGAAITGAPMLVSYQGAIVYEVTLNTGMVYVDATTGKVIANTATNALTTTTGGGQGGGEGGEGGEHEGGEGDDK